MPARRSQTSFLVAMEQIGDPMPSYSPCGLRLKRKPRAYRTTA